MIPVLSLITGTLDRPKEFNRLVGSIVKRTTVPYELIVSDASQKDHDYDLSGLMDFKYIVERPRLGCVKGYNRAFERARGKWVIWLNDDAEVMPGYDVNSINFMEEHPEVGVGALYYAEKTLPYIINEYQGMIYPNFGIISKELGERIGWMDDDLTMYGNDNSIAFRVLMAGKGIGSITSARIWHHVVLDKQKIDNQKYRTPDATKLMSKYKAHLPRMLEVYSKTKHLVGPLSLRDE